MVRRETGYIYIYIIIHIISTLICDMHLATFFKHVVNLRCIYHNINIIKYLSTGLNQVIDHTALSNVASLTLKKKLLFVKIGYLAIFINEKATNMLLKATYSVQPPILIENAFFNSTDRKPH